MNYFEARQFIENISVQKGSVFGTDAIKLLLNEMGDPQASLKVIHVAGTNGKGSIISYISSILIEAGYKVGTYNSPSVFEYLEMIRINGEYISTEDYAKGISRIAAIYEKLVSDGKLLPTAFELETALAFEYFKDKKCDIVIVETGMGGRLDGTNVCDKVLVSVIASISYDHMTFLGETIEEIAYEKAGIIKSGCPVVVYNQSENVLEVIKEQANKTDSKMFVTTKPYNIRQKKTGSRFDYKSIVNDVEYSNLNINLLGEIQIENACVALEIVEILRCMGYNISEQNTIQGLDKASWPGRFEKIIDKPLVYIDGAHNPGAVEKLHNTITQYFDNYKKIFIMGVFKDKDFEKELEYVIDDAEFVITVTPKNARALDAEKLAKTINDKRNVASVARNMEQAVDIAVRKYEELGENTVIIAFGSLSYLKDIKDAFFNNLGNKE